MRTTMDIYHKESSFSMGKVPHIERVSPSNYSSSKSSVLPRHPSLLQKRSPIRLSVLTARTIVKPNTIHHHPDCTSCQMSLSMIKCSEFVPRSESTSKMD